MWRGSLEGCMRPVPDRAQQCLTRGIFTSADVEAEGVTGAFCEAAIPSDSHRTDRIHHDPAVLNSESHARIGDYLRADS